MRIETIKEVLYRFIDIIKTVIHYILSHKKLFFIYIPAIILFSLLMRIGFIYYQWNGDRSDALNKLSRYKQLIDRTEDIRKGRMMGKEEIDLSAKVVDIPTRIYDRNDEIIGEFFEQKREIIPFDEIPEWLVKGVVASEDRDFYKHNGMNFRGIGRAILINIASFRLVQGGSTITQQLAKVLFTDMDRSLKRKIYEMFCALEIEKKYDKQDIISMYLNLIYFGNGAYGVEATSKMFFGVSARELNETECAAIVATISNPKFYSPLNNLPASVKKTKRILDSMIDAGYMKKDTAESGYKNYLKKWNVKFDKDGRAVSSKIGSFIYSTYRVNRSPFFNEMIRRVLVEKFGEDVVKKGGLSVYTTIDGARQDAAVASLKRGILSQRNYHIANSKKIKVRVKAEAEARKAENIEGALVSINPYTGEIISYVGGYEFSVSNQFDSVSQVKRQPGSSFKPVVYLAAIESKDVTPSTIFVDEKTVFDGKYSPENSDAKYLGNVTVREALKRSLNIVTVKILQKTGYDRVMNFISKSLNIEGSELKSRFGRTLSLALGAYEISPMEAAILHSVIANGGDYVKPYGIKYVKDYNGNTVWNNETEVIKEIDERRRDTGKIADSSACAVVVSMMRGVFEENGTASWIMKDKRIKFQIAGKTGTSSNYSDAWFAGYTSNLVTIVWVGNKEGSVTMGSGRSGSSVAAPVWYGYIMPAYRDSDPPPFRHPDSGIRKESICMDSGKLSREGICPNIASDQLYLSGTEPRESCDIHINKEELKNDETEKSDKNTKQ